MRRILKHYANYFIIVALFLLTGYLFAGSVFSKKTTYNNSKTIENNNNIVGKQLFEMRCNICHGIKSQNSKMLAPPFYNIKSKYSKIYRTKSAFKNAIVNFVSEPKKENTIMYGAVKQFGVMPKLSYPKDELLKIAEYIYNAKFQKPVWCNGSKPQQHN